MTVSEICSELKKIKSAVIFSHIKPDGDTLGSAYALKLVLKGVGISSCLVCDSDIPAKFSPFIKPGEFTNEIPKEYGALIAVDSSDELRLGKHSADFLKAKKTFNIDHHISNTRYADYNLVEDRSSTAEIILKLCKELQVPLTLELAQPMMLGICTDTGNFAHKNVTPETLFAAGELLLAGADLNGINYWMFKRQSEQRARLFAVTMSKIRYFEDKKIALCAVTMGMLEEAGAGPDMTEGFIDFPLSVDSVEVAVCMLQSKNEQFKISFRSKGKADVNEIAAVFGGGGHVLASGCMINGALEEVVDKLIFAIKMRI